MRLPTKKIAAVTELTGFRPAGVEKTIRLMRLLDTMHQHPFLKEKLALKGGAALNLFFYDIQKLSTSLCFNYIGVEEEDSLLEESTMLEELLPDIFIKEGFTSSPLPKKSVNSAWSLKYQSSFGQHGDFRVDIDFMCRSPLFPVKTMNSHPLGSWQAHGVRVMDIHEIVAEKLVALLSGSKTEDLFDVHRILHKRKFSPERLRIAYLVYGAANQKDWRTVTTTDVGFGTASQANKLAHILPLGTIRQAGGPDHYGRKLVEECRRALSMVLPLYDFELEFLDLLLDEGEIDAAILTADPSLQNQIQKHPLLEWKVRNIRQHKALP